MYTVEQGIKDNLRILHNFCRKFCFDYSEAQLLKSVALEKMWRLRSNFNGNVKDFVPWMYVVVLNSAKDRHRDKNVAKRKAEIKIFDVDYFEHPKDCNEMEERIDNRKLIDDLIFTAEVNFSELHFTCFKMVIDGYKYDEAAKILGIPSGSLKSHVARIRTYLSDPKNIISRPVERVA